MKNEPKSHQSHLAPYDGASSSRSPKREGLVLTPEGWRQPFKPDPHRLHPVHDYHSRCMYMVTMNAYEDASIFGDLEGGLTNPHICLTPLGQAVEDVLLQISDYYPETQLLGHIVMPNHLHMVLFTKERNDKALGDIIRGIKIAVNKARRELFSSISGHIMTRVSTNPAPFFTPVFSQRYHHYCLTERGELESWLGYIQANPYRLAYRNAFADYYNIQREVRIGHRTYDMVGNSELLKRPLLQVLVHRAEFDKATGKPTSEAARAHMNELILKARKGAVLISPFISPGELAIRDVAIREGLPVIMMLNHGFCDKYKPSKTFFDLCHQGKLLQITPWTYKYGVNEQGYDRFHGMNDLVEEIVATV